MIPDPEMVARIEAELLRFAGECGPDKTACPTEVARHIGGGHPDNWGPLMTPLRKVAVRLANEGRLVIIRKGKPADPNDFRGLYRIALPRAD